MDAAVVAAERPQKPTLLARLMRSRGGGGGGRGRGNAPPDPNGSGVFRSDDGGKTWTFESNQNQRPTYFSQIRVDPVNDKKLFVGGNPGADVAR